MSTRASIVRYTVPDSVAGRQRPGDLSRRASRSRRRRPAGRAPGRGRRPAAAGGVRGDGPAGGFDEPDALPVADALPVGAVAGEQVVLQAEHQLAGDGPVGPGDESHPVRGEPGAQEGHLEHQGRAQAELHGGRFQDGPGGEALGPGQVEVGAAPLGEVDRRHQGGDDVVDGHGLGARAQPAGQHHRRQARGQVADDDPGEAAGADDHARPQLDGRRRPGAEGLPHLQAAEQVLGRRTGGGDAPQVHQSLDAGPGGRPGEAGGLLDLPPAEVRGAGGHAVHQIEGDAAAVEQAGQVVRRARFQIGFGPLPLRRPAPGRVQVAGQATHRVAGAEQRRPEGAADEAGGAGEQDSGPLAPGRGGDVHRLTPSSGEAARPRRQLLAARAW